MSGQRQMAQALFTLLAEVLDEGALAASDAYIDRILEGGTFWAVAAVEQSTVVGGLTAHLLPMTRAEQSELLIYDVAVDESWQRRGVGKMLVDWVRKEASVEGVDSVFVLADNEDAHAISFYKTIGGAGSPVTLFEWE